LSETTLSLRRFKPAGRLLTRGWQETSAIILTVGLVCPIVQ
jgi:hypothetical protein